ncbi:MAG: hypothetical protein HY513_00860 [Candidatus Aenigmarchaeota archaeon]|nr:hypothetical protein [Candidatus Aenigmarchaeota archaeon]
MSAGNKASDAKEDFMFRHLLKERDQEALLDELLIDSEGWDKGLAAFEIYMDECFEFPFEARFRNKEYGKKSVRFVVLRLTCCRDKGGVFCEIRFRNGKTREIPVYEIAPLDAKHERNIVLQDYIRWLPFKV